MHPNKKILIVVAVVIILGVAIVGTHLIQNSVHEVAQPQQATVPTATSSVPATPTMSLLNATATAQFEGTWYLPFSLTYDASQINVSASTTAHEYILQVGTTTREAHIVLSYEGARGLDAQGYWNEIGKQQCPGCQPSVTVLPLIGATGVMSYATQLQDYVVATIHHGEPWVVFIYYPPSDPVLEPTLKTLTFPAPTSLGTPSTNSLPEPY